MPLSPKAAAARLGISVGRVRQLIATGALRATNVGVDSPLWAIDEAELARFAALTRPDGRPRKETSMTYTVEQIALRIYEGVFTALAYDPEIDTLAESRRINSGDGWTIEVSAPLGSVTRCEGVRVNDAKLVAAHELALSWLRS